MSVKKPSQLDPHATGNLPKDIGNRLRLSRLAIARKRGAKDLSQQDFAKAAGLLQSGYNMVESGVRPISLRSAMLLCDEYDLSLDWIFRGNTGLLPGWLLERIQEIEEEEGRH